MPPTPARLAAAALTLALACTDRPIVDGESETATVTGAVSDPTIGPMTTAATAATSATSASTVTTTTATSGPTTVSTSGPATVTASAAATSATTLPPGFCGDGVCDSDFGEDGCNCSADCYGCPLPPPLLQGCPAAWHGGSAVTADTATFGPFDGATAYFAWEGFGETSWSELRLLIFDASIDHQTATSDPWSGESYALRLSPPWNYDQWLGADLVGGWYQRMWEYQDVTAFLEITGRAGNWDVIDPGDPPRLLGWVTPADEFDPNAPSGPFDAVFCDAFISMVIPE